MGNKPNSNRTSKIEKNADITVGPPQLKNEQHELPMKCPIYGRKSSNYSLLGDDSQYVCAPLNRKTNKWQEV